MAWGALRVRDAAETIRPLSPFLASAHPAADIPAGHAIRAAARTNQRRPVMLDPALWDLLPDGTPRAVFPRSLATASAGDNGVLLIEYAETPDALESGPYKTIQLYLNKQLAQHFHSQIDATITS
jgi:hypothetical protein